MRSAAVPRHAALLVALLTVPLGCRSPTEAVVEITTDGACKDVTGTGITAGLLGAIETSPYGTTTSACQATGEVGSIVLLPPDGQRDAPFAFKVVTSLGAPIESCVAPAYGPSCIVARRAMRFVPHEPFHVPVRMSQACAGVICPEDQTCMDGTCHSATVDPASCGTPGGCEPAPAVPPAWQKKLGGPGTQLARHIALGADGTLAVTGSFDGSVDLGGGELKSHGGQDIFLATYSQAGSLRWAKSFGAAGLDEGASVAIDPHGEIYLLAKFEGSVDFGGGLLASKGGSDVALVKYTSFGKPLWALGLGGASSEDPGKVAVGADKNVYVVGQLSGPATFGSTTLTPAGGTDVFVASFTPAGELRWAKAFGGKGNDGADGVGVDALGRIYVGGFFEADADFGAPMPLESLGVADVFVLSLDAEGAFRWAKSFGSKGPDILIDLAARGDRVVVTGQLSNQAMIDGTVLQAKQSDGFVASFDGDGTIVWGQVFGGDGGDQGESVDIAANGDIVIGGELFLGSAFGSPPVGKKGVRNPFVARLEANGAPRWAKSYSSSNIGQVTGVAAASDGYAFLAGWFTETLAVEGETLTSQGAEDMVLLRIAPP